MIRQESRDGNVDQPRARGRPRQPPAAFLSQLHRMTPSDIGAMDQICTYCGAKHWICEKASASTARNVFLYFLL